MRKFRTVLLAIMMIVGSLTVLGVSAGSANAAPAKAVVIKPWKVNATDIDGGGCYFRIKYPKTAPQAAHITITRSHVKAPLWTADYYPPYSYNFQAPAYSVVFSIQRAKLANEYFRVDGKLVKQTKVYVDIITDNPTC